MCASTCPWDTSAVSSRFASICRFSWPRVCCTSWDVSIGIAIKINIGIGININININIGIDINIGISINIRIGVVHGHDLSCPYDLPQPDNLSLFRPSGIPESGHGGLQLCDLLLLLPGVLKVQPRAVVQLRDVELPGVRGATLHL